MNKSSPVRRAVILAAGRSQRLESLKLDMPKPLLEVAGRPLLGHHLDRCAALGIEEVFINLHYLPGKIRAFVGDGSRWKIKVTFHEETELAGTAGAVKNFAAYLQGEPFLVIYGDNYCTFSLNELIEAHFQQPVTPDMSLVLFELENVSGSGVAVCNADGFIQSFIEKPAPGTTNSHWVNAGVYLLEPDLLATIPEGTSDFGREVIPALLKAGRRLLGVKTRGRVHAVDTPELLKLAGEIQRPG